jgi:hypothetical protein
MVSEKSALICFSVHVPHEVRLSIVGLELVDLGEDKSLQPKKPRMAEENRDDRAGDHIKMFLK